MNIWQSSSLLSGYTTIAGTADGAVAVQVTYYQDSYEKDGHDFIGGTTVVTSAFSDDQKGAELMKNGVLGSIFQLPPPRLLTPSASTTAKSAP
jgi:hypothetical protein